jgi:superfamily II DNA or RNA helicase
VVNRIPPGDVTERGYTGDMAGTGNEKVSAIGSLDHTVQRFSDQMLAAYRENPRLIDEHAGLEENISQGGYGRRQIHELIQNGADELIASPGGRIHVVLTSDHLYCANEGSPITEEGVASILMAHVSSKRGDEIGRFGLGFKSVLGVTNRPEFFSKAVSFGFDKDWAESRISAVGGSHEAYPILRIARLLDLAGEAETDPVLAELSKWATTVVRLPLMKEVDWLEKDLDSFDSAFLLFSPHVGALELDNQRTGVKRSIQMRVEDADIVLEEGDQSRRWRVFRTELKPSEDARRQAGKLQHREKLPIIWAVPVDGRLDVGQFWAFFPLRDETTLSGVVNAPWQVNDDRTALLEYSRLNEELIAALVDLVFESLPQLVPQDDPGRVLDLTPARGAEAKCWGDEVLTTRFNDRRVDHRLVADQDGVLRRIRELQVPNLELPRDAQDAWAQHVGRPLDWAHPSVSSSRTRRHRVRGLLDEASLEESTAAIWLEALLSDEAGPAECAEAIKVAGVAARSEELSSEVRDEIHEARIALNDGDEWSLLHPEWIWISDEQSSRKAVVVVVHADVVAHDGARDALDDLGILPVTPLLELNALLPEAEISDGEAWSQIWQIAREVDDTDQAADALRTHLKECGPYVVRAADGLWKLCTNVLLPGRVIATGSSTGQSAVVDAEFHAADMDLMRRAGMSDGPFDGDVDDDRRGRAWKKEVLNGYSKFLAKGGGAPQRHLLAVDRTDTPLPLAVMPLLHGDDCERFVALLLEFPDAFQPRNTKHRTSERWPVSPCDSPAAWAVKRWGVLKTSFVNSESPMSPAARSSVRIVSQCVGPGLDEHGAVLPVAEVSPEIAGWLGLPQRLEDIPEHLWAGFLGEMVDREPEELGSLLTLAVEADVSPISAVSCTDESTFELSDVVVSTLREDAGVVEEMGMTLAVVKSKHVADALCRDWGMRSGAEFIKVAVVPVGAGEPVPALDLFPGLEAFGSGLAAMKVVMCDEIVVERSSEEGSVSETVDHRVDGDVLFVAAGAEDEGAALDAILDIKEWDLEPDERMAVLESRKSAGGRALSRSVAKASGVGRKVLLAVGRTALLRRLPKQVIEEMTTRRDGSLSDKQVAELALAVHGVEILAVHREDLRSNGLDVPHHWAGGSTARRFVLDLGFPREYAGFEGAKRDPLLHIPGPTEMPPLHDFQSDAAERIRELIRSGKGRGMLSLPTGAGKTRTAVQAIIESMREGELKGPVLWVAQTDELCEQAVSAWSDNWRAAGPRETLRLARLWSDNGALDLHDRNHVVVATMAKLEVIMDNKDYEWLSFANAVVVDEAHRAISPAYTRLLNWLGMGRGKQRAPLVGLTATPFRGTSKEQTKALVNRFDNHRFDAMDEDPYGQLQNMGVLSRVEHRLLAGADLQLSADELAYLKKTRLLPASALEKIGENKSRNQTLLESILSLPDDHTVLLFAASVPHAELMAGLLSAEGVPSRAISAKTDRGARRYYIEQFREGEMRVLTNYDVFTEGFDAPAVRAVYVARPTYSPNRYQQMIGRGLRGPLNGGKDLCLIVNVKDNLAEYGESLAFNEFEYLWSDE